MNVAFSSILLSLFAVAPPTGKQPVLVAPSSIHDRVGLFSPEAVEQAQLRIDEIQQQFGISLSIETINELPDVTPAELRKMSNRERNSILTKTAQTLAKEANCNGLFVLIITDPRHVTVVTSGETWEGRISAVKRRKLQRYLARGLASDPDHALIAACDLFRDLVHNIQARTASPFPLTSAYLLLGALLGIWLLLRIIRRQVVSPALPLYQPAMLGSLFGVPAGYWINDRLFQMETPVAPPATASASPAPPQTVSPDDDIATLERLIEEHPIKTGELP